MEELKRSQYNYIGATVIDHKDQCIRRDQEVMNTEDVLLDGQGKLKAANAEIIFMLFDVSSEPF